MALAMAGFAVALLAAAGCGMALLRVLRASSDSLAERFVMGAAVGLGLLAYAILAVGLLGHLRLPALLALVAIEGAVGARELMAWARGAAYRPSEEARHPIATLLLLYCVFIATCTLVGALAPPSGDDWDSLAYHLAAPKIYLAHGRIAFILYDSHTDFPFTMEMLYTLGLAYGGVAGAKLFHWGMGCLTALAIAAFCWRLFPPSSRGLTLPLWAPPLAAALFLSIPQVQWEATTAYIDLSTALYQFLALVALVYAHAGSNGSRITTEITYPRGYPRHGDDPWPTTRGWLIVSGLMSGWAMGTKMTAMVPFALLVLAAGLWAALEGKRRTEEEPTGSLAPSPCRPVPMSRRWSGLAALVVVGILVASPWYVKSYLWTNNPVYPFFYRLFPHSVNWTRQADEAYRHEQHLFGLGTGLRELLMAPWNLAMQGWAFFTVPSREAEPGTLAYFDGLRRGGLSASFLGLVPLAIFTRRWDRRLTGLIAYGLLLLLPWFVLSQQSRYLLPVTAPLAVVAAAVVPNLEIDLPRWAAGAFVTVVLILHGCWGWSQILRREAPVVFGQISPDQYLRRTFQPYEACLFINTLPATSKVALYQETRGFYLDRDYLWANPLQNTLIPYERFSRGAELVHFLRARLQVTHVLINNRLLGGSENDQWYRLLKDAIDHNSLIPVFESHGVAVYAVAE